MLKDCGSETGTWVRAGQSFCREQHKKLTINIHRNLDQIYMIDQNRFVFEHDDQSAEVIDEVFFWAERLRRVKRLDYDLLQILEEN